MTLASDPAELYIGLMSGTSLDGVDATIIRIDGQIFDIVESAFTPFDLELRRELLALNRACHDDLARAALAGNTLAARYAATISTLLDQAHLSAGQITAIGCHGQTIRHRPDLGFSIQIGNASLLAELTGITVIADFRNRDISAGGQGAPLVPAFHAGVFRSPVINRVILNIGGISNLTWLPISGATIGFDCGPGNLLLDAWAQLHLNTPFDRDGEWATGGKVIPELLRSLLSHPFFALPPPKSTGRDMFHLEWLQTHINDHYAPVDVQATLLEFTARAMAEAIQVHCPDANEVYLCGGGAHNSALKNRLTALLPQQSLDSVDKLGIGADWVEAAAFAWLAHQCQHHRPGNLPQVTGAKGSRILGAIYPA